MQTILDSLREALDLIATFDPELLEIIGRSLQVTLAALLISTVIGLPFGAALGMARRVPARTGVMATLYTGMALPPVVVGLFVYLLLSRAGPLSVLDWLFTPSAMISAQVIIALPLVTGLTLAAVGGVDTDLRLQVRALGATRWQTALVVMAEARTGVLVAVAAAFGAIISEVGAVMLVGGNIAGKTRVLTTAIVLETRKGEFALALALGMVLLLLAFIANALLIRFGRDIGMER
ncbi:MAG: ABC transporter permease [Anaerolineales bacterium]